MANLQRGEVSHHDFPVAALEKHYTALEVAKIWAVSEQTVRRVFGKEPGVLTWGREGKVGRTGYMSMRIPESVLIRVHQRMRSR